MEESAVPHTPMLLPSIWDFSGSRVASIVAVPICDLGCRPNPTWGTAPKIAKHICARQAIPMVWDFAEGQSPFSPSSGNLLELAVDVDYQRSSRRRCRHCAAWVRWRLQCDAGYSKKLKLSAGLSPPTLVLRQTSPTLISRITSMSGFVARSRSGLARSLFHTRSAQSRGAGQATRPTATAAKRRQEGVLPRME